jgi:hypothetical protein
VQKVLETTNIEIPFVDIANGILIPDDLNKEGLSVENLPKTTHRLFTNPFAGADKKAKKGGKKKKKGGKKKKKKGGKKKK